MDGWQLTVATGGCERGMAIFYVLIEDADDQAAMEDMACE
jgi:hypothetical protein